MTPADAARRSEMEAGLLAPAAAIAPKFFYDPLGSRLFAAITELSEYYPPRTEAAILAENLAEIVAAAGSRRTLVDLGAGNCEKAARLFAALQPVRYVAVDISTEFLAGALDDLRRRHPGLEMLGIAMDFTAGLTLPPQVGAGPRLLFYPGSSIGNFSPAAAEGLLRSVRAAAQGGGLLIGVDLVKPVAVLEAAYDDALGVTAAFNLNLLNVANTLLGADFAVADFRHVALFNAAESRIEMHLEARRDLTVRWPGATRKFGAGERIHTENSCKYTINDFADLLGRAGFRGVRHWTDAQNWFGVFWADA